MTFHEFAALFHTDHLVHTRHNTTTHDKHQHDFLSRPLRVPPQKVRSEQNWNFRSIPPCFIFLKCRCNFLLLFSNFNIRHFGIGYLKILDKVHSLLVQRAGMLFGFQIGDDSIDSTDYQGTMLLLR